jgi:hypothetical protein
MAQQNEDDDMKKTIDQNLKTLMNLVETVLLYLFFNAFILRNNIPCDKLIKSFGMRYSTSYADPGLTF